MLNLSPMSATGFSWLKQIEDQKNRSVFIIEHLRRRKKPKLSKIWDDLRMCVTTGVWKGRISPKSYHTDMDGKKLGLKPWRKFVFPGHCDFSSETDPGPSWPKSNEASSTCFLQPKFQWEPWGWSPDSVTLTLSHGLCQQKKHTVLQCFNIEKSCSSSKIFRNPLGLICL